MGSSCIAELIHELGPTVTRLLHGSCHHRCTQAQQPSLLVPRAAPQVLAPAYSQYSNWGAVPSNQQESAVKRGQKRHQSSLNQLAQLLHREEKDASDPLNSSKEQKTE